MLQNPCCQYKVMKGMLTSELVPTCSNQLDNSIRQNWLLEITAAQVEFCHQHELCLDQRIIVGLE